MPSNRKTVWLALRIWFSLVVPGAVRIVVPSAGQRRDGMKSSLLLVPLIPYQQKTARFGSNSAETCKYPFCPSPLVRLSGLLLSRYVLEVNSSSPDGQCKTLDPAGGVVVSVEYG